jgi:hypothetical protein
MIAVVMEEPPPVSIPVVRVETGAIAWLLAVRPAAKRIGEASLQIDRDKARCLPTGELSAVPTRVDLAHFEQVDFVSQTARVVGTGHADPLLDNLLQLELLLVFKGVVEDIRLQAQ